MTSTSDWEAMGWAIFFMHLYLLAIFMLGSLVGCRGDREPAASAGSDTATTTIDAGTGTDAGLDAGTIDSAEVLISVGSMPLKSLAVVDDWLFYSGIGRIWKLPKTGGEPIEVAKWDGWPWPSYALSPSKLCWPNRANIDCMPRTGGTCQRI